MFTFHVGPAFESAVDWLNENFEPFFDMIKSVLTALITNLEALLLFFPTFLLITIFALIAWKTAGKSIAIFTFLGLSFVHGMELWPATMETLSLVLSSALVALVVGIPLGILSARSSTIDYIVRPLLDLMQTMPAFVYLIPAVLFFNLGDVPGAVSTIIFSMPPAVRLTTLGIRQVPEDVVEAAQAFGSTPKQLLLKVQIPLAIPTILAGVNQTIMLALSMVVIAAMIGAGGLGTEVLRGITQLKFGLGFESGLAVVILAMVLDRITQSFGRKA